MTLRDRVGLGIGVGAPSCPPGDALTSPRRVSLFGTTSRVLAKDPFEAPRRLAPSPRKRPARDDARATTDAEAAAAVDASVAPRKLPRRARVLDPEDARASSLSFLSPGENAAAAAAAAAERKDECLEDDDDEEDADADDAKSPPLSCVTKPPAPSTAESSTADASGGGGGGGGGARLADAFSAIQLLTPVSGAGEGGRSRALSSRLDAAWDL